MPGLDLWLTHQPEGSATQRGRELFEQACGKGLQAHQKVIRL